MADDAYSLDRLEDIVGPDAVSWWPPAPFWYCFIAIVAVWLVYAVLVAVCRWVNSAYRRQAIRELEALQDSASYTGSDAESWALISTILKRVALVSFPREKVASLSGDEWLRFLSETNNEVNFADQPMCYLASAAYDPCQEKTDDELRKAVSTAKKWVIGHRAEATP